MKTKSFIFLLLMSLMSNKTIARVTLGTDGACDYSSSNTSIQDLIDAGEETIAITNQSEYFENLIINSSVNIQGGYNDCVDATNINPSGQHSVINGGDNDTVIKISTNTDFVTAFISDVTITNGYTDSYNEGGGLTVTDPTLKGVLLETRNVLISNSDSKNGGGIYISGSDVGPGTEWKAIYTTVLNNRSTNNGGGLYCSRSLVKLIFDSGISLNSTSNPTNGLGKGGGVYATNACVFQMESGTEGGLLDFRGIQSNTATSHGGGIFANFESQIQLNYSRTTPNAIIGNVADSDNNLYGNGGGIYLEGQNTKLYSTGALIKKNKAFSGGGMSVNYQAEARFSLLRLGLESYKCWNILACNQITHNSTSHMYSTGGAVHINDAYVSASNVNVSFNKSKTGNAFYLENQSGLGLAYSNVYKNGYDDAINLSNDTVFQAVDSHMYFYNVTSAHNLAQAATIRTSDSEVEISRSIFFEPETGLLANAISSTVSVACAVVDNEFGLSGSDYIIEDPLFIDAVEDDYHLQAQSPAIDLCGNLIVRNPAMKLPGRRVDIDGEFTNWDDPNIENGTPSDAYDAGADESYEGDYIFKHDFNNHTP